MITKAELDDRLYHATPMEFVAHLIEKGQVQHLTAADARYLTGVAHLRAAYTNCINPKMCLLMLGAVGANVSERVLRQYAVWLVRSYHEELVSMRVFRRSPKFSQTALALDMALESRLDNESRLSFRKTIRESQYAATNARSDFWVCLARCCADDFTYQLVLTVLETLQRYDHWFATGPHPVGNEQKVAELKRRIAAR